jgi:hypothetical protein
VTNTVTNSNVFEGSVGLKYAEAVKATVPLIGDVTTTLEGNFGAKFGKTWGDSDQRQFQVSGSSTVTLPAGRM